MNKNEMKKVINKEFGFSTNKITLLEGYKNSYGTYDYIMFEVCGIEYQINYDYTNKEYILRVFSNERVYQWL